VKLLQNSLHWLLLVLADANQAVVSDYGTSDIALAPLLTPMLTLTLINSLSAITALLEQL
jgi:hypothetical protein